MSSIQPASQSDLKTIGLGIIISAMLYGGVAALALTYTPLLLKTSPTISRRMRNFLLAYVTFMVTVSTVNTVTLIIAFAIGHTILYIDDLTGYILATLDASPNGLAGPMCIAFAGWGANGFIVSFFLKRGLNARVANHFIFSASYGGARCYMKEYHDLDDWQR